MKGKDENNQEVFVDQEGVVVLECPLCSYKQSTRVDPMALREKNVRDHCVVRCQCQTKFAVTLEFRKDFRKLTDLRGEYICLPRGKVRGTLKVVDVSKHGIGLEVSGENQFNIDDELLVLFNLDDANDTLIEKRAKIRFIKGNFIGCEAIGSFHLGKALRNYLENESAQKDRLEESGPDEFDWTGRY